MLPYGRACGRLSSVLRGGYSLEFRLKYWESPRVNMGPHVHAARFEAFALILMDGYIFNKNGKSFPVFEILKMKEIGLHVSTDETNWQKTMLEETGNCANFLKAHFPKAFGQGTDGERVLNHGADFPRSGFASTSYGKAICEFSARVLPWMQSNNRQAAAILLACSEDPGHPS